MMKCFPSTNIDFYFVTYLGRPGHSANHMLYSPEHHDSVTSDQQLIESSRPKQSSRTSSFEIENLLKTAEQVTTYCRSPQETRKSSPTGSVTSSASNADLTPSRQLTDAEKLRKVILELVDTERAYVKVKTPLTSSNKFKLIDVNSHTALEQSSRELFGTVET